MNLAEEMEHVETLDQKFLQKIFDRIDVNKKGSCEFQMLHPCFCTEKMVKTENKKTCSPGLQLPQFSGILAINYTFLGDLTSFFMQVCWLWTISWRVPGRMRSFRVVWGSWAQLFCDVPGGLSERRDPGTVCSVPSWVFFWMEVPLFKQLSKNLGSTIHLCFYECIWRAEGL